MSEQAAVRAAAPGSRYREHGIPPADAADKVSGLAQDIKSRRAVRIRRRRTEYIFTADHWTLLFPLSFPKDGSRWAQPHSSFQDLGVRPGLSHRRNLCFLCFSPQDPVHVLLAEFSPTPDGSRVERSSNNPKHWQNVSRSVGILQFNNKSSLIIKL